MINAPGILWTILFFVVAVFPLVVLHELGHYGVARLFGVKAEVFSIGFGKALAHWRDRRGTLWQIGWLPLGGYVRFAGDMGAASEPSADWMALPADERNRTFQAKPLWQRALIVLAGPAANFLVAMIIVGAIFGALGEVRIQPLVGKFAPQSAARDAGLQIGDRIVAIDGQRIERFDDIALIVQVRAGQPTPFVVERSGGERRFTVTPRLTEITDLTGSRLKTGLIGVSPDLTARGVTRVRLTPLELPGAAAKFTVQSVRTIVTALGQIILGERSVRELGGPVKMATTSSAVAQLGFVSFLLFMAMVSINLGFINLLPIPTLDGGHLAFYAAEAVRRKPVGQGAQEWAYRSGLIVLLAFMLFVTINDLAGLGLFGHLAGLIG